MKRPTEVLALMGFGHFNLPVKKISGEYFHIAVPDLVADNRRTCKPLLLSMMRPRLDKKPTR
jgi:hypothetical protein